MGSESYVLRWNEFQSNIVNSFAEMRGEDDFFDVILACDEDHQLPAHKVILAASSPYFKAILKRNPGPNPVLIMPPNVAFNQLAFLLDFMYHGEVAIPNDELNNLLRVANLLKVKGLVDEKEKAPPPPPPPPPALPQSGQQRRFPAPPPAAQHAANKRRPDFDPMSPNAKTRRRRQSGDGGLPKKSSFSGDESEVAAFLNAPHHLHAGEFPGQAVPKQQPYLVPQAFPSVAAPTGPQLIGLKCPQCTCLLPTPDAFREHMRTMHETNGGSGSGMAIQQPVPSLAAPAGDVAEASVACDICDKTFKNYRYMMAHQKRVHKLGAGDAGDVASGRMPGETDPLSSGPPREKKRGRPKKLRPPAVVDAINAAAVNVAGAAAVGGHIEMEDPMYPVGPSTSHSGPRPVGQVHPAPRQAGGTHHQELDIGYQKVLQPQPQPLQQQQHPVPGRLQADSGARPSGSSRGGLTTRGPQRMRPPFLASPTPSPHALVPKPRTSAASPHAPRPGPSGQGGQQQHQDLKKSLGLKLGGQISITSSEQPPRRVGDGQGVSITKVKGDLPVGVPVSIKDQRHAPGYQGQPQVQHSAAAPVEVKEEPVDDEEFPEEGEEDYGDDSYDDAFAYDSYGMVQPEGQGDFVDDSFQGEEELEEEEEEEDDYDANEDEGEVVTKQ